MLGRSPCPGAVPSGAVSDRSRSANLGPCPLPPAQRRRRRCRHLRAERRPGAAAPSARPAGRGAGARRRRSAASSPWSSGRADGRRRRRGPARPPPRGGRPGPLGRAGARTWSAPRTTSAGIWSRGQVAPLPRGTLMGIPARGSDAPGPARRRARRPGSTRSRVWRRAGRGRRGCRVVRRRPGRPAVVDRLVEPLARWGVRRARQPAVAAATVPAVWAAAHAGTQPAGRRPRPRAAADGTRGLTAPPPPVFAGIRGGVGRLPLAVRADVERLGGGAHRGHGPRAAAARRDPGAAALGAGDRLAGRRAALLADAVVLAVPARPAARLLTTACPGAAARLAGVDAASMALVTAVLPGAAGVGDAAPGPVCSCRRSRAGWSRRRRTRSAKWGWLGDQAGGRSGRPALGRPTGGGGRPAAHRRGADRGRPGRARPRPRAPTLPAPLGRAAVVRWGGGLPQYAVGHVDLVERGAGRGRRGARARRVRRLPGRARRAGLHRGGPAGGRRRCWPTCPGARLAGAAAAGARAGRRTMEP